MKTDMKPKKLEDRLWQIGPYEVRVTPGQEDTESNAMMQMLADMHLGNHRFASTYQIADRLWMIDRQKVRLSETMGDTEEQARSVLKEAASEA